MDRQIDLAIGLLFQCFFQACQRSAGTRDAHITGLRIFLERQPAGETAWEATREEGIQEKAVIGAVDIQMRRILIRKSPADIVVAGHVIYPGSALRQSEVLAKRLVQQVD